MKLNVPTAVLFMENQQPGVKTSCVVSVSLMQNSSDGFSVVVETNLTDKLGGRNLRKKIQTMDFIVSYHNAAIARVKRKSRSTGGIGIVR